MKSSEESIYNANLIPEDLQEFQDSSCLEIDTLLEKIVMEKKKKKINRKFNVLGATLFWLKPELSTRNQAFSAPEIVKLQPAPSNMKHKRFVFPILFSNNTKVSHTHKKEVGLPTIITPKGSAKPERVANLNACHLLRKTTN